jgi:hypothetical protein
VTDVESWDTGDGHVVVRLDTGDLALESIRAACEEHDVEQGAVVSAIGTLRNLRVHFLTTDDLSTPRDERNDIYDLDGCWEISGISGLVADGEPHLHVVASDGDRTLAGHLEEGNEINALGEVLIRRLDGPALTRTPNEHDVSILDER